MKARNVILFSVAAVFLMLGAGCSGHSHSDHTHGHQEHESDVSAEANGQASLEYLIQNYPTRDQMLRVRECVTARTGYEYLPLRDDYGPNNLTKPDPVVDRPKPPREARAASFDCIFDLGLENRFFPPWDHDKLRADDQFGITGG